MQKINIALYLILAPLFTACQVYHSHFDCPPGEGVPCTSLTDIESMIVETDEGPDIFLRSLPCAKNPEKSFQDCSGMRRIWVNGTKLPCGNYVEAHYIYFSDKG